LEYSHRPYRDATDIARMKHVAGAMFARVPSHPLGGIEWVVFGPHGYRPAEIVRLWERHGDVAGWALLGSADSFDYRLMPELLGSSLEEEIFGWGTENILAWRAANKLGGRCIVEFWSGDATRLGLLAVRGWVQREVAGVVLSRTLDGDLPSPQPPGGWTVSGLTEQHIDSRAQTQFEAFAPGSRTTPDTWRHLMRHAPGYDPDLDSIAISPDGEVGAAALVWLDHERKTGEFEPVGTRPQYRRMGIGRAVLSRGLAKMRERGVETAIVGTNAKNTAAIALYESVGFTIVNQMTTYERLDHART
jgi:mycothiol synthase